MGFKLQIPIINKTLELPIKGDMLTKISNWKKVMDSASYTPGAVLIETNIDPCFLAFLNAIGSGVLSVLKLPLQLALAEITVERIALEAFLAQYEILHFQPARAVYFAYQTFMESLESAVTKGLNDVRQELTNEKFIGDLSVADIASFFRWEDINRCLSAQTVTGTITDPLQKWKRKFDQETYKYARIYSFYQFLVVASEYLSTKESWLQYQIAAFDVVLTRRGDA